MRKLHLQIQTAQDHTCIYIYTIDIAPCTVFNLDTCFHLRYEDMRSPHTMILTDFFRSNRLSQDRSGGQNERQGQGELMTAVCLFVLSRLIFVGFVELLSVDL